MSGGGTTTSVQSNQPPQQFLDAYSQVMQRANDVSNTPYQAYPGQTVAGFSPDQIQAMDIVRGSQGMSAPYINSAADWFGRSQAPLTNGVSMVPASDQRMMYGAGIDNLNAAAGPAVSDLAMSGGQGIMDAARAGAGGIYGAAGRGARDIQQASASFTPGGIADWYSPFQQSVMNSTADQMAHLNEQQRQGIVGNSISRGSWGGDRSAVAEALLAGEQQRAQAPVLANLANSGFNSAAGLAAQRAQMLQQGATAAGNLGLQGATSAGGLGVQGATSGSGLAVQGAATRAGLQNSVGSQLLQQLLAQQQLGIGTNKAQADLAQQGGYGMAGLGREALNSTLTGAQALSSTGAQQQGLAQANLNVPYQQFLAAQQYPFQTTGWLANIGSGLGSASGGTSTTSQPAPSALSQVAGLGMTGAGIIGATGGFGANGWLSNLFARGGGVPRRASGGPLDHLGIAALSGGMPDDAPTPGGIGAYADESPWSTPDAGESIVPQGMPPGRSSFLKRSYGQTATSHSDPGILGALGPLATVAKIATLALRHGGGIAGGPVPHRAVGGIAGNDNFDPGAIPHLATANGSPFVSMAGVPGVPGISVPHMGLSPLDAVSLGLSSPIGGGGGLQGYLDQTAAGAYHGAPSVYVPPPPAVPSLPAFDNSAASDAAEQARMRADAMAFLGGGSEGNGGDMGGGGIEAADMGGMGDMSSGAGATAGMDAGTQGMDAVGGMDGMEGTEAADSGPDGAEASAGADAGDSGESGGGGGSDSEGGEGGEGEGAGARGGGIAGLPRRRADGGSTDDEMPLPDDTPDPLLLAYSDSLPMPPVPPPGRRGNDEALPVPPIPPDQAGGRGGDDDRARLDPWKMLLYSGLGVMGGTSPNAGVNLGRGAATGMQLAQRDSEREAMMNYRRKQADASAAYHAGMLDLNNKKADTQADLAEYRKELLKAQAALADERAKAGGSGTQRYTYQAGEMPDPENPDKKISGMWRLPSTGDEPPKFMPNMNLVSRTSTQTGPSLSPDALNSVAERMVAGDQGAMAGLGFGNAGAANRAAVQERVTEILKAKGLTGADLAASVAGYMGERAGARTAGTREANVSMAVNEAKLFMPLAVTASDKVNRTQFPTLNSIIQAVEKGTGDEDIVRLSVATNSLINAYSRAVTPTGVPTEGNQMRARELLDKAWSAGQYRAAVDQLMQEMVAAQKSPIQTREEQNARISGRPAPTPEGQTLPPPPKAATAKPAPLPPRDQLVAGQVYQTQRGPAKWTGSAFVPVAP